MMYLLIEKSMVNDGFQIWRGDIYFSLLRDRIQMPSVFCYLLLWSTYRYYRQLFNFRIFSVLLWPAANIFTFNIKCSSFKTTIVILENYTILRQRQLFPFTIFWSFNRMLIFRNKTDNVCVCFLWLDYKWTGNC